MEILTPTQKLDTFLLILNSGHFPLTGIQNKLDEMGIKMSVYDIRRVTNKMEDDNHIYWRQDICFISFDGELFLQMGGYAAKAVRDETKL